MTELDASRAETPAVCVVVLNRHGREYTAQCLRHLAAVVYPGLRAVLIDNGCAEFSAEEVHRLMPGAAYLRTEVNRGFTGGVNLGIQHALAGGAAYVFLLNNDTRIDPNAIAELIAVANRDANIGIVGAKLLQLDAPDTLESAGVRVELSWGRIYQIGFGERDRGQYDAAADVPAVSGGAILLSRAVCERLSGFDDRYFRYLEDVDVCLRARAAGFRVVLCPRARVYHKGKGMTGGKTGAVTLYYATRNHLLLMREHAGGGSLVRTLRALIVLGLNTAYALRAGSGSVADRLAAVGQGARDYRAGALGPGWSDSGRSSGA